MSKPVEDKKPNILGKSIAQKFKEGMKARREKAAENR